MSCAVPADAPAPSASSVESVQGAIAPPTRVLAWLRQSAPQHPPCFESREQWVEWLAFAQNSCERAMRPWRLVSLNGRTRRVFNERIDFCVDCMPDYRRRMLAQRRCHPDHFEGWTPPELAQAPRREPKCTSEDLLQEFAMLNSRAKGARAELELFQLLTEDLQLKHPLRRSLSQSRSGGSDAEGEQLPWSIEVKNHVKMRRGVWWRQAVSQAQREGRQPILFYRTRRKRGAALRSAWMAVVPLSSVAAPAPNDLLIKADVVGCVVPYDAGVAVMRTLMAQT